MAYIDMAYYEKFGGREIPASEFPRIAQIASDTIYGFCRIKPDSKMTSRVDFKNAVCYETELIYEQGGIDCILGMSDSAISSGSESLGDYSISGTGGNKGSSLESYKGIPISPLAFTTLEELGLMSRWMYAAYYRNLHNGK